MPTFTVSLPPTTNNLFINAGKRGRRKSPQYTAWIMEASWAIKAQFIPMTKGKVDISLVIFRPNSVSDLDNRIKPLLDIMVNMGLIEDDKYIQSIYAKWGGETGCTCTITEVMK